ncbi:hypothetical protein [Colwellia psychrerythraea]|uniref:Uncharacterized protein n=1 Tax=Colwellia psychrerythraea TaxID=28229 RepID=A0A099KSB7_COLPS|nr:hypothetical protein [Colwellia psychrerythraea]KGJ92553.1 hypothetical protein ND2E_2801 [Colwellia psychrerythraea]
MHYSIAILIIGLTLASYSSNANKPIAGDISHLISKEVFISYHDVADFIEQSPKVTITVMPSKADIDEYGQHIAKTLTGSDCDRDGVMDDNKTCNAVFYKLWLKYAR